MAKKLFSKSKRKFIRREKARIRRSFLDLEKREEKIKELYSFFPSAQQPKGKEK